MYNKFLITSLLSLMSMGMWVHWSVSAFENCNQTFTGTLRYGATHYFGDSFSNSNPINSGVNLYLQGKNFDVEHPGVAPYVSDEDDKNVIYWTKEIKAANYTVAPGQSIRFLSFDPDGTNTAPGLMVSGHPETLTPEWGSDFNFKWLVTYDKTNTVGNTADDTTHIECANYRITWCGDGVVDTKYDETCDPGDKTNKTGWGSGGCSQTCKPIWNTCDETYPFKVRYKWTYKITDTMINKWSVPVFLRGFERYPIVDKPEYFNGGVGSPLAFSQNIIDLGYKLMPGQTSEILSTESIQNDPILSWKIMSKPAVRSTGNNYDFTARIVTYHDLHDTYANTDDTMHVECANYQVSWCGDGIVDTDQGEPCDPMAEPWKSAGTCRVSPTDETKCELTSVPPDTPICLPAKSGPQTAPVSATDNLCQVGTVSGFVATGTSPINYSWSCGNAGTSQSCTASYIPVTPPPTAYACAPTKTGTQTTPVSATDTLCSPGKMVTGSFVETKTGDKSSYTWKCSVDGVDTSSTACSADYTRTTPPPTTPSLTINKKAQGKDGQNLSDAALVLPGNSFNYTYEVKNTGTTPATKVTVTDTFPQYVSVTGTPTGTDWTCSKGTKNVSGITYHTVICTYNKDLAAGATAPVVSVPSKVDAATPSGTALRNVAYVCREGDTSPECKNTCKDPKDPTCTPPPPPPNCDSNDAGDKKDPACVITSNGFDLSIKKYVDTEDAQPGSPVSKNTNDPFNYIIRVKNEGPVTTSDTTTIKDVLPTGILSTGTPTGNGWTCTISGQSLTCTSTATIAASATFPDISVPVKVTATTGTITNFSVVHNPKENNGCKSDNSMPVGNETSCTKDTKNIDPAVIVIGVGSGFDLSIKKYIGSDDADTTPGVTVGNGSSITYRLIVTNKWPLTSSGVTTVRDVLPTGVLFGGAASWTNGSWSCTYTTATVTIQCTSEQKVAKGGTYDVISYPVSVTAGPGTTVTNYAHVNNPDETGPCLTDKTSLPTTPSTTCTNDITNSNPAVFTVPGGGGGGASNIGKKCVNGVAVCATYNSSTACINDGIPAAQCYSADSVGQRMCADQSLSCSTGPGGPTPPGGCVGPTCYTAGFCGDAVLQPAGIDNIMGTPDDEECDVRGAPWCNTSCKITTDTTPGTNPITEMWIKIPKLSTINKVWYSAIAGNKWKVSLDTYRNTPLTYQIVVGQNTNIFTLSDEVLFGVNTQYPAPMIVSANKKICLQANGENLNEPKGICTSFWRSALNSGMSTSNGTMRQINGKDYVILGQGDYQVQKPDGLYEVIRPSAPKYELSLFGAGELYSPLDSLSSIGPTLRDAFTASSTPGSNSRIDLFTCYRNDVTWLDDCTTSGLTSLATIPVRVSSAIVTSIGSSADRQLEKFMMNSNIDTIFSGFLGSVGYHTSTTTNNSTASTTQPVQPINIAGGVSGPITARSVTTLVDQAAVNGNPNILAISGDLTITGCDNNNTFVMTGIRTVIVTGNIIIKCNIAYDSNDSTSSWAWIAKNGNIQISNGIGSTNVGAVTNIAWVYVAIKETTGGDITYIDNNTTTAILRVDGSLYGNAEWLFKSRFYARATGAYEMLTTGTVLNYSNRALVNPPPLLSQYLGTYQVQRVIQ